MKNNDTNLKTKAKNKKRTMGKHKKKMLRVLVYIVLVVFMLSLLFLIGYGIYYFRTSSKYNITEIEFQNNLKYDEATLLQSANIPDEQNIHKLSSKEIANNIKELPYVQEVKIKKIMPGKLLITIQEYTSTYYAYNTETNMYVRLTKDGVILEQTSGEDKHETEMFVHGIAFDSNIEPKQTIAKTEKDKLSLYEKVSQLYYKEEIGKNITSVEFKEKNIILTLDYDLNVIFGNKDLDYNMNFLKDILVEIEGLSGTIDMTKTSPVFTESIR